ncbi:SDR family NAD(P)-dependent oxidoreductase [Streptomyces sp. 4503]|uniref:SDR family NAD(P)-dependent oxidoreductase n=1 Tax=Streptomyces niphimycinicus TaxID=2842201 RepID=A0ABS6C7D3_9ACTN|nr:SDR family NAD(P)-dependent oxidoreductase [Streptomyces niphimycinicus]MBU3862808.1 SDR family NAD(P)-dependent oxidoreductase [Streptomyces niphimycinicus]
MTGTHDWDVSTPAPRTASAPPMTPARATRARELARQGFHVLAGVRRDRDADAIRSTGIEPVILDITHSEQVGALAARVARDSRAARARQQRRRPGERPLEALSMAQWRQAFEVNLFGHIAVTQALLPALLRSKGRVINISSIGGKVAMATYGAYAGSATATWSRRPTR